MTAHGSTLDKARESCPTILGEGSLRSGWHCPPGWSDLVLDTLVQIERYALEYKPELRVDQVKEKFGGLRLYMNLYDEYVEGVIGRAANASVSTCDVCGQPGTQGPRPGSGWIRTLCEEHRK